jgi:uncharacterized repeat protein (TIGR01451 family)
MLPMTCNEGYFHDAAAGSESLSEAGVRRAQNGVIASWAPTGFGLSTGHDLLERGLFLAMFYDRTKELGAAATAGKLYLIAYGSPGAYLDLIDTFLLLGDPALRVPLQPSGIDIQKTPDTQQVAQKGTATFTIRVENTGDVALTNVTVTDALAPDCARSLGAMNPDSVQSYECTLANVSADFTNVATATGTPPVGPNVTGNDDAVVDVLIPAIDIRKTPDRQLVAPGGTATFTIRVENTGEATLSNVIVSDAPAPNCNRTFASLAPGAVQTYICSLANVQAGFTNVATVTGTPPVGSNVTDNDDAVVENALRVFLPLVMR